MILLDTNVVSELMKPDPNSQVLAWFARIDGNDLFTGANLLAKEVANQLGLGGYLRINLARAVMGPELSGTSLLMEDTWSTEMFGANDNDGLYVHGMERKEESGGERGDETLRQEPPHQGHDEDGVRQVQEEVRRSSEGRVDHHRIAHRGLAQDVAGADPPLGQGHQGVGEIRASRIGKHLHRHQG